jgi:hypothetical protein
MRRTIGKLSALHFDVILSNSFAAAPSGWLEAPPQYRKVLDPLGASRTRYIIIRPRVRCDKTSIKSYENLSSPDFCPARSVMSQVPP